MKFNTPNSNIHIISRGLLIQGDEIILCRPKDKDWFFLPGGHVEDGESAREALFRELKEELGDLEFKIISPIGICENIFPLNKETSQHELNIIFEISIPSKSKIESRESHIEFIKVKRVDFKNFEILPVTLKDGILERLMHKKTFFKEI